MPSDPALAAAVAATLDRQRALSTARAVLADPPGDDDALLDAAELLAILSPDLSEREGAAALLRWLAPAVSS